MALIGALLLSRLLAYAAGVRFDATPLHSYWQLAPPALLQHDLPRTIWWLNMQPPGLNILAGTVLQLPHSWQVPAFAAVYLLCGVVIVVGMYALGVLLGLPRWAAALVAVLFGCSPAAIVYENLLFYPYLVATGLTVTFLALFLYLRDGRARWGLLAFSAASAVVMTRATYHLLWLVALIGIALLARPRDRRRTLLVALVPVLCATTLYAKNWVQVGSFTSSSWFGLNLADVVRHSAGPHELTGILATPSFLPLNQRTDVLPAVPRTGVPIVDHQHKTLAKPNYNNLEYVKLSGEYLTASERYIRGHPGEFATGVVHSFRYTFTPATSQPTAQASNGRHLRDYERAYDLVVGGEPRAFAYYVAPTVHVRYVPPPTEMSWFTLVIYLLALGVLPVEVWLARRRRTDQVAARWILAAASATIWIALISGAILETTENSRFRFETDPLAWVLAAVAVCGIVRAIRRRRHRCPDVRDPDDDQQLPPEEEIVDCRDEALADDAALAGSGRSAPIVALTELRAGRDYSSELGSTPRPPSALLW